MPWTWLCFSRVYSPTIVPGTRACYRRVPTRLFIFLLFYLGIRVVPMMLAIFDLDLSSTTLFLLNPCLSYHPSPSLVVQPQFLCSSSFLSSSLTPNTLLSSLVLVLFCLVLVSCGLHSRSRVSTFLAKLDIPVGSNDGSGSIQKFYGAWSYPLDLFLLNFFGWARSVHSLHDRARPIILFH